MNDDAIEKERSKSNFTLTESIYPGVRMETELRNILASRYSKFQKIDVVDTVFGKTLITDGKTQSCFFDEFAYHESLVHPSLLLLASQRPPKTVFIGGGGELATAREVLRHRSIERVVMVDLDEDVVNLCREYLPEWGGDDVATHPKLELIVGDAHAHLLQTTETFDVIIMDISDPIEAGPGIILYTQEFYEHATSLLNDGGVFVTQGGMAEAVPLATMGAPDPSSFGAIVNTLSSVFQVVLPYSSAVPSFGSDWGFVLATNRVDAGDFVRSDAIDALVESSVEDATVLRWYDQTTHWRMFHLSKPLRRYLDQDDRIMTKENPIFMY